MKKLKENLFFKDEKLPDEFTLKIKEFFGLKNQQGIDLDLDLRATDYVKGGSKYTGKLLVDLANYEISIIRKILNHVLNIDISNNPKLEKLKLKKIKDVDKLKTLFDVEIFSTVKNFFSTSITDYGVCWYDTKIEHLLDCIRGEIGCDILLNSTSSNEGILKTLEELNKVFNEVFTITGEEFLNKITEGDSFIPNLMIGLSLIPFNFQDTKLEATIDGGNYFPFIYKNNVANNSINFLRHLDCVKSFFQRVERVKVNCCDSRYFYTKSVMDDVYRVNFFTNNEYSNVFRLMSELDKIYFMYLDSSFRDFILASFYTQELSFYSYNRQDFKKEYEHVTTSELTPDININYFDKFLNKFIPLTSLQPVNNSYRDDYVLKVYNNVRGYKSNYLRRNLSLKNTEENNGRLNDILNTLFISVCSDQSNYEDRYNDKGWLEYINDSPSYVTIYNVHNDDKLNNRHPFNIQLFNSSEYYNTGYSIQGYDDFGFGEDVLTGSVTHKTLIEDWNLSSRNDKNSKRDFTVIMFYLTHKNNNKGHLIDVITDGLNNDSIFQRIISVDEYTSISLEDKLNLTLDDLYIANSTINEEIDKIIKNKSDLKLEFKLLTSKKSSSDVTQSYDDLINSKIVAKKKEYIKQAFINLSKYLNIPLKDIVSIVDSKFKFILK